MRDSKERGTCIIICNLWFNVFLFFFILVQNWKENSLWVRWSHHFYNSMPVSICAQVCVDQFQSIKCCWFFLANHACELLNSPCFIFLTELDRAAALSSKLLAALPAHVTSQSFPSHILVQIVAINIFSMHHAQRMTQYQDGEERADSFSEELGSEELRSFSLMFSFTSK